MKQGSMPPLTILISVIIALALFIAAVVIFTDSADNARNTLNNLTACESSIWKQAAMAPDAEGATCAAKADCSDLSSRNFYVSLGPKGCPEGEYCCLVIPTEETKSRTVFGNDVGGETGEEYLRVALSLDNTILMPEVKNAKRFSKSSLEDKHIKVDGPEGYECAMDVSVKSWKEVGFTDNTLETYYLRKDSCKIDEPLDQDNLFEYTPVDGEVQWVEITLRVYEPGGNMDIEYSPAGSTYTVNGGTYYVEIA